MSAESDPDLPASRRELDVHARLVRALQQPAPYPHPVDQIKLVETHISSVLLTGRYAYKIKKPLDLGFVDYGTLGRREHFCLEELRLNRRLAPDLYLAVVAITGSADRPKLGASGRPIEYAVKMRQFSQDDLLSHLLERGQLEVEAIEHVASRLARFHGEIETAGEYTPFGKPESVLAPMHQNFEQLRLLLTDGKLLSQLARLERWTGRQYQSLVHALTERKARGYIRECHGDLHLNNIVQLNGEPTIFDGVEFNDALRWIDVMSELAFLIMDLDDRGAPGMANRALNAYLHKSGDYGGILLLRFYQVYRAVVRAKIACIRVEQNDKQHAILDQYRSYASLAERYTQAPKPYLLINHGVTGSGKSTISRQLADVLGAIWLRSDVERGRDGYGVNRGRYSVSARDAVYDRLLQLSGAIIDSGFGVIVDATFLQAAQRASFRALSGAKHLPFLIIETHADEAELRERVGRRLRQGDDPSEADLEVLDNHLKTREPLFGQELAVTVSIEAGNELPVTEIRRRCGLSG